MPLAEVRPADCARLLDEVRSKHPTTANDLLRHLKAIFAFGIRRHRVDGSPVAAFVAAKDAGGKEESRHAHCRGSSWASYSPRSARNRPSAATTCYWCGSCWRYAFAKANYSLRVGTN